jgi:glycosyltransferase involved in cell wall biosynthesis
LHKLVIQIPCLNEEESIARTLADLPREVEGFDFVETLLIDDGCTDSTVAVARAAGVSHVLSFPRHRGLAAAFSAGLEESLRLGADVIVHTDADNQYRGACVADLVRPVCSGQADIVVGVRPIDQISEFSAAKKALQRLGSWVVRQLSNTQVADVTSGFRAYSREAALRLTVLSGFTYTHETLIQAGRSGLVVAQVPVQVNPSVRLSRLSTGTADYVARSLRTILHVYAVYQPLPFFASIGLFLFLLGGTLGIRYLALAAAGEGRGHVHSVVLAGVLVTFGVQALVLGVLAELIGTKRKLVQETLYRIRKRDLDVGPEKGDAGSETEE